MENTYLQKYTTQHKSWHEDINKQTGFPPNQCTYCTHLAGFYQRPCITRQLTPAVLCLGWLDVYWKFSGSCKGRTGPPAYDQSCPAVIWGVLQLWKRRITKWCTLSTASTKLSISGTRRASSLPYFSLVFTLTTRRLGFCTVYTFNGEYARV